MKRYVVRVQHGTYSQDITVYVSNPDEEIENVKTKARKAFFRRFGPPLGMACNSDKIISVEDVAE